MPRDNNVLCVHCQTYMSRTRERAHRAKHHAPLYSPPPRIPSKLRRIIDIDIDIEPEPEPEQVATNRDTSDGMIVQFCLQSFVVMGRFSCCCECRRPSRGAELNFC
jgi:hypothetical protein